MEKQNPNQPNSSFHFCYNAKDIKEAESIRKKYLPNEKQKESPMEALRRLDRGVTQKADIISLVSGVLGTLVLGSGMSLILLTKSTFLFLLGILIGIIGLVGIIAAYPLYLYTVKKARERIAPEILRLTDQMLSS